MLEDVVKNKDFVSMMQKHNLDVLSHLFDNEQNFGIFCKLDKVTFEPKLPKNIRDTFNDMTLFYLAEYTFQTAHIQNNMLIFEAGFGSENFGSTVSVPLLNIIQIIIDETPIAINLSMPQENIQEEEQIQEKNKKSGVKNSMESFLSNPENSKFLKK